MRPGTVSRLLSNMTWDPLCCREVCQPVGRLPSVCGVLPFGNLDLALVGGVYQFYPVRCGIVLDIE